MCERDAKPYYTVPYRSRIRIPDHFSTSFTIQNKWNGMELRNITFLKLGEITHADKGMNPINFGSDRKSGFKSRITCWPRRNLRYLSALGLPVLVQYLCRWSAAISCRTRTRSWWRLSERWACRCAWSAWRTTLSATGRKLSKTTVCSSLPLFLSLHSSPSFMAAMNFCKWESPTSPFSSKTRRLI